MSPYPRIFRNLVIFSALGLSSGCERRDEPNTFMIADVCFDEKSDINSVKNLIADIARTRNMKVYDRSADTFDEMKRIAARSPDLKIAPATLNLLIENENRLGLVAGNLGSSARQFDIAFFRTREDQPSKDFSARTVEALEAKGWRVKVLPGNHRVIPDKSCA